MATWDVSESLGDDSNEEQANMALMESAKAYDDKTQPESESEFVSDFKEVFPNLYRSEFKSCQYEILENYQKLQRKYKDPKQFQISESEAQSKHKKDLYTLLEENFILKNENSGLQSKISKL